MKQNKANVTGHSKHLPPYLSLAVCLLKVIPGDWHIYFAYKKFDPFYVSDIPGHLNHPLEAWLQSQSHLVLQPRKL